MPECVKSYTESLHTYLEAVRSKHLDAEIIDRLIADPLADPAVTALIAIGTHRKDTPHG